MTPSTARSPYRLLVLALACQASISIVQWGLGVIAPDLQSRYGLSAAGLGALVNATALGNAVALIVAGVIVDRSGPRIPLLFAGSASGLLLIVGSLLTNPVGLGLALFASGVAGAVVAVGATVSVFYGFPPERRGLRARHAPDVGRARRAARGAAPAARRAPERRAPRARRQAAC